MAMANERSRQRAYREYLNFRRKHPKEDVTFLDAQTRRERICETEQQLMTFVRGLLSIADDAKRQNRDCYMILDVETDYTIPSVSTRAPQPHYWHIYQLKSRGLTDEQIAEREQTQSQLCAEFSNN